ncbi:hypothetical protein AGMMS50293_20130 [Spirochaetia bacterium]|nr:hypothetical protein AGMMS50293_20130 [Spirochaetia bacterium]
MEVENNTADKPPKVFISYAWSSPQHERWVLELASNLRQQEGVDVVLDKWDLNLGNDSLPFMEQMVNDDTVKKVLMICDKNYVEKANKRKGGVGIETQIISKKVYEKSDQNKFVAVIREKNDDGSPCVPAYCHSRMYIDFTSDATFAERFRELVLWIYDKPIYPKPELGSIPNFMDKTIINPGTIIIQKRVIDNILNGRNITQGSIKEYFEEYYIKLELFRVRYSDEKDFIEDILKSLDEFSKYRDEFLVVMSYISKYEPTANIKVDIHKFFENTLAYLNRSDDATSWNTCEFEIYKFIIYELFIYTLAILLKDENYDVITHLLNKEYFIKKLNQLFGPINLLSFCSLRNHCDFIDSIKKYGNMLSPQAAFLKERNKSTNINFYYLMEADFMCFIKAETINQRWWPGTLIYLDYPHRPFEIFAKSITEDYFENIKRIFGFRNVTDIAALINDFTNNKRMLPVWEGRDFNLAILIGYEQLSLSSGLLK